MKRMYAVLSIVFVFFISSRFMSCSEIDKSKVPKAEAALSYEIFKLDTSKIPHDKFGDAVRYGRDLMLRTAYWIGPDGVNGKFLGNKMNCTNCHQDAGTKPYSFNLITTYQNYPSYRTREGKVLSMAERVNNCIMHPHLGKPLPLDSKEMIAFLSYFKWMNDSSNIKKSTPGVKNLEIAFPAEQASSSRGEKLYQTHCRRCHGKDGEGVMQANNETYIYPPLWGMLAYQPGSSMHRIIKMSQWLVANMPHTLATHDKPVLSPKEAFDLAAFINDDEIHQRPPVKEFQYPNFEEKAIDYDRGPFNDPFSEVQHKYGPYQPIIDYLKSKGVKPTY